MTYWRHKHTELPGFEVLELPLFRLLTKDLKSVIKSRHPALGTVYSVRVTKVPWEPLDKELGDCKRSWGHDAAIKIYLKSGWRGIGKNVFYVYLCCEHCANQHNIGRKSLQVLSTQILICVCIVTLYICLYLIKHFKWQSCNVYYSLFKKLNSHWL